MGDEFLGDRRKALEEAFFRKEGEELKRRLQEKDAAAERKRALREASGIQEDALLERLVTLGVHSETLAALSLVPLVEVAWADGRVSASERRAILKAAADDGLRPGDVGHDLLEGWLDTRPGPELLVAWKAYVVELCGRLGKDSSMALREDLLGRARSVARSAGGLLGIASISGAEKTVLEDLAKAFS